MLRKFGKKLSVFMVLVLVVASLSACKGGDDKKNNSTGNEITETVTPSPTEVPATPTPSPNPIDDMTLKEVYKDDFRIGVALPIGYLGKTVLTDEIKSQFNSMTFENSTKPDAILRQAACAAGLPGTYTEPVINLDSIESYMKFAKDNDIAVRFHTLVWHSQTPTWFFTEDYSVGGTKVSREVMLKRLESYIRQVVTLVEEKYPGQVYCYDVVNEAIDPGQGDANGMRKNSLWYEVIGPDFMEYAFKYARQYAPEGVDLYYNDYNCYLKTTQILKALEPIKEAGNIDGIGMQGHISISNSVERAIKAPAVEFTAAGYKVQITELDIGISEESDANLELQAMKYRVLFKKIREAKQEGKINIDCITIWGLYDSASWRQDESPLLYQYRAGKLIRKRAWYGAMQDPSVKAIEL
jgi:Beta-1,4-xylanase|uniref:Putative carbohydrate-active enzyme n=1 Tax=uncultured organism TaxID=155900 RepID=E9NSK5_9ZZZZ|nr:putative carbohydrate-active enzyme [uncultured organism]